MSLVEKERDFPLLLETVREGFSLACELTCLKQGLRE